MYAYYRHLLALIFAFAVFVSESRAENIPTDTILSRLYDQAASLMEEGEYDSAQLCFDRAFATEGVTESPVYPILLNEQATLFFYVGELKRSLEMKKSVLPYLPEVFLQQGTGCSPSIRRQKLDRKPQLEYGGVLLQPATV